MVLELWQWQILEQCILASVDMLFKVNDEFCFQKPFDPKTFQFE